MELPLKRTIYPLCCSAALVLASCGNAWSTAGTSAGDATAQNNITTRPATQQSPPARGDDPVQTGTAYFVAVDGTGDGTIDSPFGTIDEALAIAQPFDVITLRSGTHLAPYFPADQAIDIPNLTIQGYEGELPHIESPYGSGKKIAMYFGLNADDATLRNLEISGGDVYTIQTESNFDWASDKDAATGLTIQDSVIHSSGEDVIKLSAGSDGASIIDSEIYQPCLAYTSGDLESEYPNCQGLDNVNSDDMLVQGNHFHDIAFGNPALFFKGGARDAVVERNLMEDAYAGVWVGGQTDIDFYSPDENPAPHFNSFDGVVRNNIMKNMRGECVAIMSAGGAKIYNNTLIDCGTETGGLSVSFRHQPTYVDGLTANEPTVDAVVVNNLIAVSAPIDPDGNDFVIEINGHYESDVESETEGNIIAVAHGALMMDHNLYWNSNRTDLRARDYNEPWLPNLEGLTVHASLAEWSTSSLHNGSYADLHSQYANPAVNADGTLAPESPAVGAGMQVDGLVDDYYGNPRTGPIDIGAVSSASDPDAPPVAEPTTTTTENATESLKIAAPPEGQIYHAAYPDFGGWEDEVSATKVSDFEELTGKPLVWAMFSNNWWQPDPGIAFPSERVEAITSAGVVPYIRMMPRNEAEALPDPDYSTQAFIDGEFDQDLKAWAQNAKATEIPLMVEFGTEANGFWFPWNAKWNGADTKDEYGDPAVFDGTERFRDAYRHIIDLFNAEGVNNITWVFHADAYNDPQDPWNAMGDYYPGDDYIDWIGISVYGPQEPAEGWWSFEDVLTDSWDEIMAISDTGKPIAIMEWGVIDNPDIGNKAQWISDAFAVLGPNGAYPEIAAISYWHENFDETNLRLDSSPDALAAYQTGIASEIFTSAPT